MKPEKTYLTTRFVQELLFHSIVTVNLVYQATVVHLNPLQLVLVGTLLEAVCFVFEIPTGVMADLYSRKLSTVVGIILIGLGFMTEASVPSFTFVLLAQVLWGIGFTFVSGAREAWISDEIGEEHANHLFVRAEQLAQVGGIIGIILSVALATINIRLPIFLGGLLYSLWGLLLWFLMTEHNFHPTPKGERSTWSHFLAKTGAGITLIKSHHLLWIIILVGGIYGMFSETFDRLWTPFMLNSFTFPTFYGLQPIVWFGIINIIGMLMAALGTEIIKRTTDTNKHKATSRALVIITVVLMLATLGFALSGNFYLALAFFWMIYLTGQTRGPVYDAWLNQNLTPDIRATMFSMASQSNALGQILGGPLLGLIATSYSIKLALISGSIVLIPVALLYLFSINRHQKFVH